MDRNFRIWGGFIVSAPSVRRRAAVVVYRRSLVVLFGWPSCSGRCRSVDDAYCCIRRYPAGIMQVSARTEPGWLERGHQRSLIAGGAGFRFSRRRSRSEADVLSLAPSGLPDTPMSCLTVDVYEVQYYAAFYSCERCKSLASRWRLLLPARANLRRAGRVMRQHNPRNFF